MKINDTNAIRPPGVSSVRKRGSTGGSSFLDYLSEADEAASVHDAAPAEAIAPSSFDAMLALQEMPEEEIRRKKMIARGHSALDQLESLRHGLLTGRVPLHVLKNLANLTTDQRIAAADPKLRELMDEIELRAAVELAKLEMSHAAKSEL